MIWFFIIWKNSGASNALSVGEKDFSLIREGPHLPAMATQAEWTPSVWVALKPFLVGHFLAVISEVVTHKIP